MTRSYSNSNFISTGIEGLDEVLSGGLPANRVYLVEGNPGSGKTTIGMQFLLEGVRQNEPVLYITLSESVLELKTVAQSHGWDISKVNFFELPFEDQLSVDAQNTFFHSAEVELGTTNEAIIEQIKNIKPKRVVVDSTTELKLMSQNAMKFRRQVLALKQLFMTNNATVLLLDDKTSSVVDQEVQSIVHGIIRIDQMSPEYGIERRRLIVSKLRGVAYRGGYHDFSIKKGGVMVHPRLVAAEHGSDTEMPSLKSGISNLDAIIGGGIERGSSSLIMGPAGSGKSTITMQYAFNACKNGEKAEIFTFDEGLKTIVNRAKGIGMDLEKYVEQGLLNIHQIDPAQLSPGQFANLVRDSVDKNNAKVIVIDSLNGYLNAMPEERFLIIQMHELLSYLSQMGVCTFLVVVQHGLLGTDMQTAVDISYLSDNVFLLRYFESHGAVKQALSVVKKRAGQHERSIRELSISSKGLAIGEPLKKYQGILTGTPYYDPEVS